MPHFPRAFRLLALLLLGLALLACLAAPTARAAQNPGLLFILDCSGSMWGRVDGTAKIAIAKEVLTTLLDQAPKGYDLGVMAYGHRTKGDCADIELVGALGAPAQEMAATVAKLNAKGKTPLADSLTMAGKIAGSREEAVTVVLVSDGIETCGGDPCMIAGDLIAKGLKLVIHVVGFDVDSQARAQLECIAKAGGGRYFDATGLDGLKEALTLVTDSVVKDEPLPEPPEAAQAPESASTSTKLKIKGPGTVKLAPASWVETPPYYWALLDAETGEERARGTEDSLRVKEGEYQVIWRQSEHGHLPSPAGSVKAISGETVDAPIDTGIRLTVPEAIPAPRFWGLREAGAETPIWGCFESTGIQVAPPGVYQLVWHQSEHGSRMMELGEVSIEAGKLNDVLADSGIALQPADWLDKNPYYYGLKDDGGTIVGSWTELSPQLAPAGTYTLVYRPSEHQNNEIIWGEIEIPAHGFAQVPINSGLAFTHAPGTQPPYGIFLVNLENGNEIALWENWGPVPVPPGRYRLDWWESQHGGTRQTLADEVLFESGNLIEVEM